MPNKPMLRIAVVNSHGPMASTVISALLEKCGYLNLPVRKLGFHDYLLNKKKSSDPHIINRINAIIDSHSNNINLGGVSVADRESTIARVLLDKRKIKEDLDLLKSDENESPAILYHKIKNIYAKGVIYKNLGEREFVDHIELTTDFIFHDPSELYNAYKKHFAEVYFINLTRDFPGWLESLISQNFASPNFKVKYFFVLHSAVSIYKRYMDRVEKSPGLKLSFDDIFSPSETKLFEKINEYMGEMIEKEELMGGEFDLYGNLCSYEKTFTLAYKKNAHLSPGTLRLAEKLFKKKKLNILDDLLFWLFYLKDMFKFFK